jgi:hypothetical protein
MNEKLSDTIQLDFMNLLVRRFCCALSADGGMNPDAFVLLCTMATQVCCTHLPWWDNSYDTAGREKMVKARTDFEHDPKTLRKVI